MKLRKDSPMRSDARARCSSSAHCAFVAAGCGDGDEERRATEDGTRRTSPGHLGHGDLDRRRAGVVPGRHRRLQRAESRTSTVKYTSGGDNIAPCSRPRSRAATRPTSPRSGSRARWRTSPSRARSSRSTSPRTTIAGELRRVGRRTSAPSTARSTASSSRGPTSRPSGTTSRRSRTPASSAPETWDELVEDAQRRSRRQASRPTRSAATDGWTLTDLFENIYLRTAGAEKYDQLAKHEIPWTDQSVKDALDDMARSSATPTNIAGGNGRSAADGLPDLGRRTSSRDSPKAAMVDRAATSSPASWTTNPLEPETGFNVFPFPSIDDSGPSVVGGGDLVVHVQGQPGRDGVRRVPDDARGRGDLGEARRLLVAEQERRPERLPGRDPARRRQVRSPRRRSSASTCPTCSRPRSAAPSGRACSSCSRTSSTNPDDIDGITTQMEAAAAKAFG